MFEHICRKDRLLEINILAFTSKIGSFKPYLSIFCNQVFLLSMSNKQNSV